MPARVSNQTSYFCSLTRVLLLHYYGRALAITTSCICYVAITIQYPIPVRQYKVYSSTRVFPVRRICVLYHLHTTQLCHTELSDTHNTSMYSYIPAIRTVLVLYHLRFTPRLNGMVYGSATSQQSAKHPTIHQILYKCTSMPSMHAIIVQYEYIGWYMVVGWYAEECRIYRTR